MNRNDLMPGRKWSTIMVARDSGPRQEDARQRYEIARNRLSGEFGNRVYALVGLPPRAMVPTQASYSERAAVIESGLDLIVPLRRFVERELQVWVDPALLEGRMIEVDDIVADVYLEAVQHADTAPVARAFYTWLRRIARRQIRHAVLAMQDRGAREQSIYSMVTDFDEEWPEDVSQLVDILADPNAVMPGDLVERQEIQTVISRMLMKLPEQWREIFLLRVVDGWSQADISVAEGIEPDEVERKVAMTREILRSWLEEARRQGAEFEA